MPRFTRLPRLLFPGLLSGVLLSSVLTSSQPILADTPVTATAAPSVDPHANETKAQRDARMKWWREARFGMFIHWGLYAVPAGVWHGEGTHGEFSAGAGEWMMHDLHIPVADYAALAPKFHPTQFDADTWVSIAKAAGMKYIVMTAKHHEGFAMYPTQVDDFNIDAQTSFKRDPIGEMTAACKKAGLKFGVYYSQNLDWHHPGGGTAGPAWDPAQKGDFDAYVKKVSAPQVRELISRYHPAVLWWDINGPFTPEEVHELTDAFPQDPELITNNRLGGGVPGDTETPEQNIPATGYPGGRDWETCMTINDTWGYKIHDTNFKSTKTLLTNLIDIASKGGNYLLNVGPTGDGVIPAPEAERLQAMGAWLKVNGEGIYKTSPSPFKRLVWGRCTRKADGKNTTLYLHVFQWPTDGKLLVPGLTNTVRSAYLLDGKRAVPTASGPDGVTLTLPMAAPDPISSTVVLKIAGTPMITPTLLTQKADGLIQLAAADANTHGDVHYESGNGHDNLGYWTNAADWVEWPIQITKPGKFHVTAEIAASDSGSFIVAAGAHSLTGTAPNTGDYVTFQTVDLGTLEIASTGTVSISVKPIVNGWQPMNLKSLTLTPTP